jgi:hypothetical protein
MHAWLGCNVRAQKARVQTKPKPILQNIRATQASMVPVEKRDRHWRLSSSDPKTNPLLKRSLWPIFGIPESPKFLRILRAHFSSHRYIDGQMIA